MTGLLAVFSLVVVACGGADSPTVAPKSPATTGAVAVPTATIAVVPPTAEAEKPRMGGTLNYSNVKDPRHYDINQLSSINDTTTIGPAFAGYVQYNPMDPDLGSWEPEMAEKWSLSSDGTAWTFNLRRNIKYHDGESFDAHDAVWNVNRMKTQTDTVRASRSADYQLVSKVEALDDYTFKISLKKRSNGFFAQFTKGWTVPVSRKNTELDPKLPSKKLIGTGPYALQDHQSGNFLKYIKNTEYFIPGKPYLDGLTIFVVPDQAAVAAAFKTGRIHLTGRLFSQLSGTEATVVKRDYPDLLVHEGPNMFYPVMTFNGSAGYVFADVKVRRAIHLALDRQAAVETVGQGYGAVGSFVQPGPWALTTEEVLTIPGYRKDKTEDMPEAKRLLAQAGFPNGFEIGNVACGDVNEAICVFTAQQLKKIDIKMGINVVDYAVGSQQTRAGNFEISIGSNALQTSDPYELGRKHLSTGDNNTGRILDTVFDDLFFKQDGMTDPAERMKVIHQMDHRLIDIAHKIVYFWEIGHVGAWPEVRGFIPAGNYNNVRYAHVWLAS